MFDTAELGRTLNKSSYEEQLPELRTDLLRVQSALAQADFPVVVLLHGEDAAGRGEVLNLLHEWLDARQLVTFAYEPETEEEAQRPTYWRYWQSLPPRGKIGLYLGSWYSAPIHARAFERIGDKRFIPELQRAAAFERTLADDGVLFIKLWLHITKAEQRKRLKAFAASTNQRYRVQKADWKHHERYEQFVQAASRTLRETGTAQVPWTVIEAGDERYRNLAVARQLLQRIEAHLQARSARSLPPGPPPGEVQTSDPITILDTLNLGKRIAPNDYDRRLGEAQSELNELSRKLAARNRSAILVFEGWDAAGKGGTIRRITRALDARRYRVIPTAAPNEEERAHHYLWRFWRHLPRRGRITIYDRSWYGRVLVERIEGFATDAEWRRAYKEINDFEEQLVDGGISVLKFWLHISSDEQMRRFKERESQPWKQYKLTPEDMRNRERRNLYESAINDMLAMTDTDYAPWTLVEAEDKRFARVKVLETICARLALGLKR